MGTQVPLPEREVSSQNPPFFSVAAGGTQEIPE
jgi:hypothetical protein